MARCRGYGFWRDGEENNAWLFADGITFHTDGKVTGNATPKDEDRAKKLRKQIATFTEGYATALVEGKMSPSGGDCWYCSMKVSEPAKHAGKTLGDVSGDKDHLLSHMREKYYVPSIIANLAIERGGFLKNIGLPTLWDKSLDAETRARMLAREGAWIKRDAKKLIRKSLQRQLGLASLAMDPNACLQRWRDAGRRRAIVERSKMRRI